MRQEFVSRLTRNRFRSSKDLRRVFEAEQAAVRRKETFHPSKEIKGVYRGQYYRVKVPGPAPPSHIPHLLNPSSPPVKKFVQAETKSTVQHQHVKDHHAVGSRKASLTLSELRQASRSERGEYFRDYWERVKTWWGVNWPVLVLNFGSICSLIGFTRTDVLELRSLSVTGSLSSVVYFMSLPAAKRSMTPVVWSLTFASVNGLKIYQILVERNAKVDIPNDQLAVYKRQFEPHGVTPKQFQFIMQKAQTINLAKGEILIREGEPFRLVYLISKGCTRAHHMGRRLTAVSYSPTTPSGHHPHNTHTTENGGGALTSAGVSGAWVGEMAFFEQAWQKDDDGSSSDKHAKKGEKKERDENGTLVPLPTFPTTERAMYTIVALEDNTSVLAWTHDDMEALLNRSSDMRAALMRAMTAAIVAKVVGFTLSRKSSRGGGAEAWIGRLWPGATQGPIDSSSPSAAVNGPPKVPVRKPVFAVPEDKR